MAVNGVQRELANAQDCYVSDTTLATVIALCDFEVVARKRATTSSWRVHLDGAKHIICMRGGPAQGRINSEFYRFLLKWLAYFDIVSFMTLTDSFADPLFQGSYWLQSLESDVCLENEFKLDPYMGFLQNIVPFFKEIGNLARLRSETGLHSKLRDVALLHKRCENIEDSLKNTLGAVSGHSWISPDRLRIVTECHDSFIYSTLIHLYRRVEGIPSDAHDIRFAVEQGLKHIEKSCMSDKSDIDSSLLFPLFTFGCEAISMSDKEFVLTKLQALGALALGNVDRAIEVLLTVWERCESSTQSTLAWNQIFKMFNWEVNLA